MPLVSTKEILEEAKKGGYGVGSFNVYNLETVQGVIKAAEQTNLPAIIQAWVGVFRFGSVSMETLSAIVKAEAEKAKVPIAFHLDHGETFAETVKAVRAGFGSVMIDASTKSLEENIKLTKKVVEVAHNAGVDVEAELGHVGTGSGSQEQGETKAWLTDPEQAAHFVKETGVDFLAVAVGTLHGFYQEEPKLDIERLKQIAHVVKVPLVLHGSSYTPIEQLREAIKAGITKINVATELNVEFVKGIKDALQTNPETPYPNVLTDQGREYFAKAAEEKIKLFALKE
jgi:fructose-bisphosphate aldolase class II